MGLWFIPNTWTCLLVCHLSEFNAHSTVKKLSDCLSEGWSIRRSELQLGKSIGKGEFGGENNIIALLYWKSLIKHNHVICFKPSCICSRANNFNFKGPPLSTSELLDNKWLPWLAVTAAQLWANLMQGFQGTHHSTLFKQWKKKAGLEGEGKK